MNIVPIAFAFDNNLVVPACVAMTSLLRNAHADTFYDIFILHSENVELDKETLVRIPASFPNCRINYRRVGNTFDGAFEIRGITTPAYYRLLIPKLIPEYDKIVYADADIIFRLDLTELYNTDLGSKYLAATRDLGLNLDKDGVEYVKTLPGVEPGNYLQSGFIVLNSALMRRDGIVDRLIATAGKQWKYQDQDTLNIVCKDRVLWIDPKYNMTDYSFYFGLKEPDKWKSLYSEAKFEEGVRIGNLHYNGHKPWKKWSVNFDIWWQYYRESPVFDEKYYFDFYYSRLNELDQLPLLKRVKILVRYFVYGKRKNP